MRRIATLFSITLLFGCTDPLSTTTGQQFAPQFELVDLSLRLLEEQINAHVYGSFAISFGSHGPAVIRSGRANFPGNPPGGPGTCVDGLWINSNGKQTSGDLARPHPHCVGEESVLEVVLEPISSCYTRFDPSACAGREPSMVSLVLGDLRSGSYRIDQSVSADGVPSTFGKGIITGYAIDASTLGTTHRRVGYLTFDLSQYAAKQGGLFEDDCSLDATRGIPCLNFVILAHYKPFPDSGSPVADVPGFLWFTGASTPYNYGGK